MVLARFAKQVKLRGYRPGKVPPNIAVKFINPQMIYQQAIQKFTKPVYDELIQNKTVQEQEIIEDSFRINVNNVSPTELELTYIFDLMISLSIT